MIATTIKSSAGMKNRINKKINFKISASEGGRKLNGNSKIK